MRLIQKLAVVSTLFVVLSFQACTPSNEAGRSAGSNPETNESAANSASPGTARNGGVPFDGKSMALFQSKDDSFCSAMGIRTGIRNEIVRDKSGHWLAVEDCKAVSARLIDKEVTKDTTDGSIKFKNQALPQVDMTGVIQYPRIKCYIGNSDILTVVVYESIKGLTLHYPRQGQLPDFVPVSAVHETGLNIVWKYPTYNKVYTSGYTSAYWNDTYKGIFTLHLMHENLEVTGGRWNLTLDSGKYFKNIGRCHISPSRYPW